MNALVLSSLHLVGAKQGDSQLTAVGVVVAALFFFVTKGQPLEKLSRQRPPYSVLSVEVLTSIAVQFFIHFGCILTVTGLSQYYLDPFDPSLVPDGGFNPNTLNTATFLMTVLATVNTFLVNYRGRPFMQDLSDNLLLLRTLQASYTVLFACALEVLPPLNELLQLAPLPSGAAATEHVTQEIIDGNIHFEIFSFFEPLGFKATLICVMIFDIAACYFAEQRIISIFNRT